MNERRRVEERLRKKEQEIQSLEQQIRDARVYVQAINDVLKLLPKDAEQPAKSILRPGSTVALARETILARGGPVHISEILEALGKEVNRENSASLGGSLAAYVRQGEIFTRPAPNTFGLLELEQAEPPRGFGQGSESQASDTPADDEDDASV